ncbi:MAG: hypothetical protein ACWIPI_08265 [Polaribacter sp.]
MKLIIQMVIIALLAATKIQAQSISASKILNILDSQNSVKIKSELVDLGFKYMREETDYNVQINSFMKSDRMGREHIGLGKNSELFMFVYKPANKDIYNILKSKLLTSEFKYSYSYKDDKFYESDNMRIGIKDKFNIISFFVALKN